MLRFVNIIIICFCFAAVHSQTPTPRASAHLFYFKPTNSLLLFDGYEANLPSATSKSEIWEWKNNNWKKIDSNDQPQRSLSGAVYISGRDEIFIYGGIGHGYDDSLKDSYLYKNARWTTISDKTIGTHDHHEMAYDAANDMIVVYGGQTAQRHFDLHTWIYKNDHWQSLNISSPGPRVHHAMAYDANRKKIVLYGGFGEHTTYDDTWEFDGRKWEKITTTKNPGLRGHHSMVYDPVSRKVLLFGGDVGSTAKGDLWSWDGKSWQLLSNDGPKRILSAVGFDETKNTLWVFGGNGGEQFTSVYSDLWKWDGKIWKRVDKGERYEFDMQTNKFVKMKD